MTLELLICTIDDGINNVPSVIMPSVSSSIRYLISWQHSDGRETVDTPHELLRPDVTIVHLSGKGLSRNRNNAIAHASSDICLIVDDDCTYSEKSFRQVLTTFESHPSLDLATFKMSAPNHKNYPSYSFDLRHFPKGYNVSSIEIAFRRTSIQGKVHFNELFGLGAPVLQAGEEEVFVLDALATGLRCLFFPIEIVTHDHPTTSSSRIDNPGVLMARGAYLHVSNQSFKYLRAAVIANRLRKKCRSNFFFIFFKICKGIRYIKNQDKQS